MSVDISPTTRTTYEVHGATLQEVEQDLPREEAGVCTYDFGYEYESVASNGRPRGLRISGTINIHMPAWVELSSAPAAHQTEWRRWLAALEAHEQGHNRRLRQEAVTSERRMARTQAADLGAKWTTELARINAINDAYDDATDHGRRPEPGTILNLDLPEPE